MAELGVPWSPDLMPETGPWPDTLADLWSEIERVRGLGYLSVGRAMHHSVELDGQEGQVLMRDFGLPTDSYARIILNIERVEGKQYLTIADHVVSRNFFDCRYTQATKDLADRQWHGLTNGTHGPRIIRGESWATILSPLDYEPPRILSGQHPAKPRLINYRLRSIIALTDTLSMLDADTSSAYSG